MTENDDNSGADTAGSTTGSTDRTALPGSARDAAPEAGDAQPLDPSAPVELTVVLRRRADGEVGADPDDLQTVRSALEAEGLEIVAADAPSRRIRVRGAASRIDATFGTRLQQVTSTAPDGRSVSHRQRTGELLVPTALADRVLAVLGIDDRPQTRSQFRVAASEAVSVSYTPVQLAEAYNFPGGHRRHRPDHRDHRAGRRVRPGRPRHLLPGPRADHAVGDRGRCRRRDEPARSGSAGCRRRGAARHRGGRGGRAGRRDQRLLRTEHRRRVPRRGQRCRPRRPRAGRDQHQLGTARRPVDRPGPHGDGQRLRRRGAARHRGHGGGGRQRQRRRSHRRIRPLRLPCGQPQRHRLRRHVPARAHRRRDGVERRRTPAARPAAG